MKSRSFLCGVVALVACCAFATPVFAQTAAAPQQTGSALTNSAVTRLSVPIGGKQEVGGLPEYINTVYQYALGVVTILAIIMVMYGAFLFLLSHGDAKKASDGQKIIRDAIGGMAVLFLAYFILYNVNPRTTRLDLVVTPIRSIALRDGAHDVTPGRSCMKDADCTNGAKCLRTSMVGGICADGQPGNICKCRGTGCQVTAEQAGGPTNNNGAGQIQCQAGADCQEIQADEWVCNGGEAMACNMSTRYVFDSRPLNQRAANVGAAAAGQVAASAVSAVTHIPFDSLVPYESVQGSDLSTTVRQRQAVNCTNGRTCFQRAETSSGACVYGDHRDMVMISNIPDERRNTYGILQNIERCDLTVDQLRTLSYPQGGCRNLTNNSVDEFCIQHRYRCASGSVCARSEYADAFSDTLAQYRSWENVPVQLRPEYFFQAGCRKPAGASCTADSECSSRCIESRCSGFAFIAIDGALSPGTLRLNQMPTQAQVVAGAAPPGSCDNSWSSVDLLTMAQGDVTARTRALEVLFQAGTRDRFACYPKRVNGNKCDYNTQCQSGNCVIQGTPERAQAPPTFNAPLDLTVGLGTCS